MHTGMPRHSFAAPPVGGKDGRAQRGEGGDDGDATARSHTILRNQVPDSGGAGEQEHERGARRGRRDLAPLPLQREPGPELLVDGLQLRGAGGPEERAAARARDRRCSAVSSAGTWIRSV